MTRTMPLLFFIVLLLTVPCRAANVGQYILTDLGDLPGGTDESYATGINNYGEVVGSSGTGISQRGFLWSPNAPNSATGSIMDLGSLHSDGWSYAYGINSVGQAVGQTQSDSLNAAYIWTPTAPHGKTGTMVPIGGDPFHDGLSVAYKISASGAVVGTGVTALGYEPFLWTPQTQNGSTGSMFDIAESSTSQNASGFDIGEFGEVVGGNVRDGGVYNGYVWTPTVPNGTSGVFTLLKSNDPLYGRLATSANAVNAAGQIVGWAGFAILDAHQNVRFAYDAAMWVRTSPNSSEFSLIDLGTATTANLPSGASDINSQGWVVGSFAYSTAIDHALIWLPNSSNGIHGTMTDLNLLLGASTQLRWTLTAATGINDFGQIIGNAMYDPDGPGGLPAVPRAFLLTPVPEPTSITLVALCGALLAIRPRSRRRSAR